MHSAPAWKSVAAPTRSVSEGTTRTHLADRRTPVTVVIPCFNEEDGIAQLAGRLRELDRELGDTYHFRFVLVNDGSHDRTGMLLETTFQSWPNAGVLHHEKNLGITAAVLTGIRHSDCEAVACLDSDCTYDPMVLRHLLPRLTEDVDLVTASPYHPHGHVANVPGWRLFLSKGASWLYRRISRNKLATYTSCCRVYRRSSVLAIPRVHPGFQGIAELLLRMDLHGARIVEHPATLHRRRFGESKLRVQRCILGHLSLWTRLLALRCRLAWRHWYANAKTQPVATAQVATPQERHLERTAA